MISIPGVIPIRIHPLFWLLALVIGWVNTFTIPGTAIWLVIIVVSVLVHEYGHALSAMVFGQKAEINLVALGGLTTRQGGKLKLWQEFVVVLNGPIAGLCLALVAYFVRKTMAPASGTVAAYMLTVTVWVNVFWTILNLLPIQPLDGGKLLSIFLESIFGLKGIKIALFISMVLSGVLGLLFIIMQNLFAGALFFMFTYESYRSWKASLELREQDQSFALQHMLKAADYELRLGHFQESLDKFLRIREMAQSGVIYQTATQKAALLLSKLGRYQESYELLSPMRAQLPNETMRLLHHVAYDSNQWQAVTAMANDAFQRNPDYDSALVNAYAYARLGELKPAIGWLQCALREGLPNLKEVMERQDFDTIRKEPAFVHLEAEG